MKRPILTAAIVPRIMLLVGLLAAPAQAALKPTHAIVKAGHALYADGVAVADGRGVGPWAHVPIMFDAEVKYTSAVASVPDQRKWNVSLVESTLKLADDVLDLAIVVNGVETPFQRDTDVTKANYFHAGAADLQISTYPDACRVRVRYRVSAQDVIQSLAIRLKDVKSRGEALNLGVRGDWDGRVVGKLPSGTALHVLVCDAKEKYPRGYSAGDSGLDLIVHSNRLPKDTSKAGLYDLRAMLTGDLAMRLPAEYVQYLSDDDEVKRAAEEIDVAAQAERQASFYVGVEFWLSVQEAVEPAPPVVLLDGFESPIWSKIKTGVGNADLSPVEARLLAQSKSWLEMGPRGQIMYGDFRHDPESWFRIRMNDHYFHTCTAWRSFLRTENEAWYTLARVYGNYLRDSCWIDGQKSHGKGLTPWSGPHSGNGHWVDSEALLLAWLVDGDYLALSSYQQWLATVKPPTAPARESCVCKRMFDVAYWYTGQPQWQAWSNQIRDRLFEEVAAAKSKPSYQRYGKGMPTGVIWHPLWTDASLGLGQLAPEGILNVAELASSNSLERAFGYILYGRPSFVGGYAGPGPLGESLVGLQMERIYDYVREKRMVGDSQLVYATTANTGPENLKDASVRVVIEKSDAADSTLTITLGQRVRGDLHPHSVRLVDPSGKRTDLTAGQWIPKYFDTGDGFAVEGMRQVELPSGWSGWQKTFAFRGPAGSYTLELGGMYTLLYGPVSKYSEWQRVPETVIYPGQAQDGTVVKSRAILGVKRRAR